MRFEEILSILSTELSGSRARDLAADIARFHRTQASPGYDEALSVVREKLSAWGLPTRAHKYPADGRSKTYGWTAPPAWTVRDGSLTQIAPAERRLASFDEVPTCVVVHSPGGTFEGDLAHVGKGDTEADYAGVDLDGRVALACGRAAEVVKRAARRGAVGVVLYPDDERAAASHDLVGYHALFPGAEEVPRLVPAFSVSRRTADDLLRRLPRETVRLRGNVDAEFTETPLQVLEAWIDGSSPEVGEVLLVAHLCHPRPSANDNASGSAVLAEAARALRAFAGRCPLRATVRFLWVPEFYGTLPWAAERAQDLRRVRYVLNLDMVGQSPERIGEPLRVFRAPNHLPSYVHVAIEPLLAAVAGQVVAAPGGSRRPLHWSYDPPSGGSDHLVFAAPPHGIPSFMVGHDDPYWHTSLDTIDNVDPTRLEHVGAFVCAAALLPQTAADDDRLLGWLLAYGAHELARAAGLAQDLSPRLGHELLEIAFSIEEKRAQTVAALGVDERKARLLDKHLAVLRGLQDHLAQVLPRAERSALPPDPERPRRRMDGPLVYAVTDSFTESEARFFKDKLSAHHRALVEGLLALCDGRRTAQHIALQLSLDAGRLVPVEDVEGGIALLRKAGYVE
jgi:aminopeptidase YwaD